MVSNKEASRLSQLNLIATHLTQLSHQSAWIVRPKRLLVLGLEAAHIAVGWILKEIRAAGTIHCQHWCKAQSKPL